MLKFIKGKGQQPTAERLKVQKELFAFSKTVPHGFPHKPSALAWDPKLKLVAIGTRTGLIRIYGAPGVEFSGQHDADTSIFQLYFLPNEGRIISLCGDHTLHLWEIDETNWTLKIVKSLKLDDRFKKISTCCLKPGSEQLLIGTETGNVYMLDVKTFQMSEDIIYQEVVMQNVPDDFKVNPGSVEGIEVHPSSPDKVLIGYNRGLIVLWDNTRQTSEFTYVGNQDLHSISWHRDGTQFMSAHSDGSYIVWSTTDSSKPMKTPHTPYGPFPCKAITKLTTSSCKGGDDFIVFSGGMPRATYGDKNSVTILSGEKHQVLDFTSKVVDFFTISDASDEAEFDNPHSLVVLVEEEIVVIDLESEDWPQFSLPYLASLHSSAITCSQHCGDVPDTLWKQILDAGDKQNAGKYSQREWPITGGVDLSKESKQHDLLLTGHEDGTIRFWDVSGVALHHLYTLSTSSYFVTEEAENSPGEEEEWPPFRKVGSFDPYSDDPRLAIKKILLCSFSGTLVVSGTAGQVVILEMKTEPTNKDIEVATVNIVGDRDSFVWKGHDQLTPRQGGQAMDIGFQPLVVMQVSPPAAITALAMHTEWDLVAAGTAHGFGLFDYIQKKTVMAKCTLNPTDMNAAGDTSMSRRKSFKKSLRESFRRLRKGRSQRGKRDKTPSRGSSPDETKASGSARASPVGEIAPGEPSGGDVRPHSPVSSPPSESAKPVERQVEARSFDDALGSMVRCLYLAQSFIINNAVMSPTLWAGTNSGAIFVFTISLPKNDKRTSDPVACQLGKEIQLKHRAPVIAIQIMDHTGYPLPEAQEVKHQRAKSPDTSGSHRVLICSEEQFKVFTLPSLKPYCKFKLTAHEGSRVRKIGTIKFQHRSDENYSEHCLTCLTNQGDIIIYSIPELRKQMSHQCIKRENINGISSLVMTQKGQGLYLQSPCEFQRFSISAQSVLNVLCQLNLPEGARPKPEPTPQPVLANDHSTATTPAAEEENKVEAEPEVKEAAIDVFAVDETPVINSPEINGEKEALPIVLTSTPKSKDSANLSNDDEKRELDTTVDSVKDHFATLTTEESVIEKREESKTVKTQETKVTVTSMTYTETYVNSSDHGVTVSPDCWRVPLGTSIYHNHRYPSWGALEIRAPIAQIEELNCAEEDLTA